MTDQQYLSTQNILFEASKIVNHLDLEGFRERIRRAEAVGPVLNPSLYAVAHRKLALIDALAQGAMAFKAAFNAMNEEFTVEEGDKP